LEHPPLLTPARARARRNTLKQSLDLVGLAIGENTPLLSKWERGLIPPGTVWTRVERKLAAYLATQGRRVRVTPPAKARPA
jgi:hypothetical protein